MQRVPGRIPGQRLGAAPLHLISKNVAVVCRLNKAVPEPRQGNLISSPPPLPLHPTRDTRASSPRRPGHSLGLQGPGCRVSDDDLLARYSRRHSTSGTSSGARAVIPTRAAANLDSSAVLPPGMGCAYCCCPRTVPGQARYVRTAVPPPPLSSPASFYP